MCVCVCVYGCLWLFPYSGSLAGEVEETPVDDIDKKALDDATYEVYETPRKHLSTSL